MKALYFEEKQDMKIQCRLCPHQCVISKGKAGICQVRVNKDGKMDLPYYGKISALALDPIEKKPLYHFYPGKMILSAGFWGCNFRCPFCQNYQISQHTNRHSEFFSPENLVETAYKRGSFAIAYTYSEPLVHYEYILDTAKLAREAGIKNVLVSNGHIEEDPARELLEYIDAANIDLKGFQPEFYQSEIKGSLEAVKKFISLASKMTSLEVTTLVIPGKNDSPEEIKSIANFLATENPDIAYHLSAYYPSYEYEIPATEPRTLQLLGDIAREFLDYVYLGNIGSGDNNSFCRKCNNLIVRRNGYHVSVEGIKDHHCSKCGSEVPVLGV